MINIILLTNLYIKSNIMETNIQNSVDIEYLINHYEKIIEKMCNEIKKYKIEISNLNTILESHIRVHFEYERRKYNRSSSDSALFAKKNNNF